MSKFHYMLVVLCIFGLAQAPAFAGTVAYWQFNNDLTDSSGNGHIGTAQGGAASYITDAGRTALSLDRVKYVTAAASSDFQFDADTEDWTVEGMVKITSDGSYSTIIDSSGSGVWFLRSKTNGLLQSAVADDATPSYCEEATGTTNITSGWHHVAMVYDQDTDDHVNLFVDYVQEGAIDYDDGDPTGLIGGTSDLKIGLNGAGNLGFNGAIDYIRLSNVALDSSQFVGAPIPEPSTIVLLATGLLGLLAYAWRKRK